MMAYDRLYAPQGLCLLYPHHARLKGDEGVQFRFKIATDGPKLTIGSNCLMRMKRLLIDIMLEELA